MAAEPLYTGVTLRVWVRASFPEAPGKPSERTSVDAQMTPCFNKFAIFTVTIDCELPL